MTTTQTEFDATAVRSVLDVCDLSFLLEKRIVTEGFVWCKTELAKLERWMTTPGASVRSEHIDLLTDLEQKVVELFQHMSDWVFSNLEVTSMIQ